MKAIILISSIFYILGLKLSHQFELIKKTQPVEKIVNINAVDKPAENAIKFNEETKSVGVTDSLKVILRKENKMDESKHF